MSNNSDQRKNKVVPLFIAFAILFIIAFGLGVIIGKGLLETTIVALLILLVS